MTREEAIKEINMTFTSAYANYIITALTEGATISDKRICDNLISREEVKKIAKEMYLEVANMELDVKTISDCISYTSSKCREVFERKLQNLPSVMPQEQKWIPITEKLPKEEPNTYWVCTNNGYQCACRWTNVNPFSSKATTDWHWHIVDVPRCTKVVAWMPLPENYKEVLE